MLWISRRCRFCLNYSIFWTAQNWAMILLQCLVKSENSIVKLWIFADWTKNCRCELLNLFLGNLNIRWEFGRIEIGDFAPHLVRITARVAVGQLWRARAYDGFTLTRVRPSDMMTAIASLSEEDRKHELVRCALAMRSALALRNQHKFFVLYLSAPLTVSYLVDLFIERERKATLKVILTA